MTPAEIRDAVAAGDYAAAARLFEQYARSLPLDDASLEELDRLTRWTRNTVLCAKAHAEDHARRLHAELQVAAAYRR